PAREAILGAHEDGAKSPQRAAEKRRRPRAHHGAQGPSRRRQDRSAGCRLLDERLQLARPSALRGARRRRRRRANSNNLCLIAIKEGVLAAAPRAPDAKMPRDNAERVVAGARALSPNLGERMMAGRLFDKSVTVRELMPQDLKIEIDQLSREQ